ncbi:MAG: DUF3592 domain-containing protein [Caldilineaceae bacterium]|nr:DUF3592 domain-containing protein [Caldilineaceae bacterium]
MAFVVSGMLMIFLLGGLGVLGLGLRDLLIMLRVRPRLLSADGVVQAVQRERTPSTTGRKLVHTAYYPEIQFYTRAGQAITFLSEVGYAESRRRYSTGPTITFGRKHASYPHKYYVGQRLPVLYDPQRELAPRLHTWSAIWGLASFQIAGGVALLGGALLLWLAFGARLVAAWQAFLGPTPL